MSLIVFDMDGVITSEEGYWKAAMCTVIDLAARLGHAPSRAWLMGDHSPAELVVPRAEIATLKGLAINTNWDLCHVAASVLLRALAPHGFAEELATENWQGEELWSARAWPAAVEVNFARLLQAFLGLRLPGRGFVLFEELAASMPAVGLPAAPFVRQGPVWQWCFRHFQSWFVDRILAGEGLIMPAEPIREALQQVRNAGWELAIATGRTRAELFPTLERFGLLELFAAERIVTHDEIETAEAELVQRGQIAQLSKPSPFPFLRALFPEADVASLAFEAAPPLPENVVFVGDTVGDMAPAKLLGARGVAVLTGAGGAAAEPTLRAAGASEVIADITKLPKLLAPM